jgi:tetratricopeptide (TPR) repeat protein
MARQCASCKLESEFEAAFHADKKSGHLQFLCPRCWEKQKKAADAQGLWFILGLAGIGFASIAVPGNSFGWFLINIALALAFVMALILPHELGHVLAARLARLRVFGIYVGWGKLLLRKRFCGVTFELRSLLAGGIVLFGHPDTRLLALRRFLTVAGGPAVNASLLVLTLMLVSPRELYPLDRPTVRYRDPLMDILPDRPLIALAFTLANSWLLLYNLWPRRIQIGTLSFENDGLVLLKAPFLSRNTVEATHALYFTLEGQRCVDQGDCVSALEWFRRGLEQYPESFANACGLAYSLLETQQPLEARQHWLTLLQKPDLELGIRLSLMNNIAVADLLLVASGRPPDPEANPSQRAQLLREAAEFSRVAFSNAPWVAQIKGARGCLFVEEGQLDAGLALLREAVEEAEEPRDKAFCFVFIARAEGLRGRFVEAKQALQAARKLDQNCIALALAKVPLEGNAYSCP